MVRPSLRATIVCAVLLHPLSSLASTASSPDGLLSPLSKRQATTAALNALVAGPATYVTSACTATCAPMTAQANACTTDTCACAASAQTTTCMNCLLAGPGTAAQAAVVQNGFEAYANLCVSEGLLDAVPTLDTPTAAVTTSSSSSSSSIRTTTSAAAVLTTSSTTSARTLTTTTTASTDSTALGLAAVTAWYNGIGGACPTECSAVATDIAGCTTDACICTQAIFTDGQTCQTTCVIQNPQGEFTSANQQTLAVLWQRAQAACGISASGGGAANTATTTTTRGSRTATGIPQQSYYAPTVTTSATTTRTGGVISNPTGGSGSTGGAGPRWGGGEWVVGVVAVGVALVV